MTKEQEAFAAKSAYEIARRRWLDEGSEHYQGYLEALSNWVQSAFAWYEERGSERWS